MGYIIEITESKVGQLAENAEKMLRYGGKVMQCIDELREGSHREDGYMGYRHDDGYDRTDDRGYGRGGHYGMRDDAYDRDDDRMGERYPRDRWEEWPPYMGERRGRSATTGRYVRR